jgi:[ribosomal protein S5]-alanine N-acetyltransferase
VPPLESISTARLLLRKPRPEDAEAIYTNYASDPVATRYMAWPCHTSLADTRAFLELSDAAWHEWPAGPYLILAAERIIGGTGFAFQSPTHAVLGYILAQDEWGQGYATEATQALVKVAPQLGLERLTADVHVENAVSAHVLEKCGFTRTGASSCCNFPNLSPNDAPNPVRASVAYVLNLTRT